MAKDLSAIKLPDQREHVRERPAKEMQVFRTRMLFRLAIICLVLTLDHGFSLACRYTVREIGFANLKGQQFALVLSWTEDGDKQQQDYLASLADEWSRALKSKLSGSNVSVVVDQRQSPRSQTNQATETASAGNLSAPSDRGSGSVQIELVDQTGRSIAALDPVGATASSSVVAQWLNQNVFVPALTQISSESLESFAHLLVVEGTSIEANQRMQDVVAKAMTAIQRLEPMLPRPIAFPLRRIVVSSEQPEQQGILRQLLENQEYASPVLAVVYGRGRLAGPVMTDSSSTLQELLAQLALVGQSCECETDRAWLDEASLPFYWDSATRSRASSFLGFDPDSPLVRAEMLRIVSQGPKSTVKKQETAQPDSPDTIARLLLRYSETELNQPEITEDTSATNAGGSLSTETEGDGSTNDLGRPAGVQSTVVAGDGWDFEIESDKVASTSDLPNEHRQARADEPNTIYQVLPGSERKIPTDQIPTAIASSGREEMLPAQVVSASTVLAISLATVLVMSLLAVFTLVIRNK